MYRHCTANTDNDEDQKKKKNEEKQNVTSIRYCHICTYKITYKNYEIKLILNIAYEHSYILIPIKNKEKSHRI